MSGQKTKLDRVCSCVDFSRLVNGKGRNLVLLRWCCTTWLLFLLALPRVSTWELRIFSLNLCHIHGCRIWHNCKAAILIQQRTTARFTKEFICTKKIFWTLEIRTWTDCMVFRLTTDRPSRKLGEIDGKKCMIFLNPLTLNPNRSSLNQLPAFQPARTPSHYLQSTTLTTTSGLGSNYTSYTTDRIDSSMNSLDKKSFHPTAPGTSSSFLESDIAITDEYLYVPEGEQRFISPQRVNQNFYGGKFSAGDSYKWYTL